MGVDRDIDIEGAADRLYASATAGRTAATQPAWLQQLARAGLPVRGGEHPPGAPWADSVEPTRGDPQLLSVQVSGERAPWWIDRRTMRVNRQPSLSLLAPEAVVAAADLADRAQLELGRPISLQWFAEGEQLWIGGICPLQPEARFTNASYRQVSALMAAPQTLSPLSVDVLDRALRTETEGEGEAVVRRLFGRAYRRVEPGHAWAGGGRNASWVQVLASLRPLAARMTAVARASAAREPPVALAGAGALRVLDGQDLAGVLRLRVAAVARALTRLEHSRVATLAHLPALRALVGDVGPGQLAALAEPIATARRAEANDRLIALGHTLVRHKGSLAVPEAGDPERLRERWARARRTLAGARVPGMDVRPGCLGESDTELLNGLREARSQLKIAPEQRRREAERELIELTTRRGGFAGKSARAALPGLLLSLRRLARVKGAVVDALADSQLALREAAIEAGRRLSEEGVVSAAEDVYYLELAELNEALSGELGAYAARSRLRHEDDLRWRNFEPPVRIMGRHAASEPADE